MKILKIVLLLGGVGLIVSGIYNVVQVQQSQVVTMAESSAVYGFTSQSIAMIGLGAIALIAGALLGTRK